MYTSVVVMNLELSHKDVVLQLVACMQDQLQTLAGLDDRCVGSVKSELQPLHDRIMCRLASLRGVCDWTLAEKQDVVAVMTAFNQLLPLTFMGVGEGGASGKKGITEDNKKPKIPGRDRFDNTQADLITEYRRTILLNRLSIAEMEKEIRKLTGLLAEKENISENRNLYIQITNLKEKLQEANKLTATLRSDAQSAETRNEEINKKMAVLVLITDGHIYDIQKQFDKSQKTSESNNVELARVQEELAHVQEELVHAQAELVQSGKNTERVKGQIEDSKYDESAELKLHYTEALDTLNARFVKLITFTGEQKKLFNTIQNSLDTSVRVVQGDEEEETMPDFYKFKELLDAALANIDKIKIQGGDGGGNIEAVQQALAIVEKLAVDVLPYREDPLDADDGYERPVAGNPLVEPTYGAARKIGTACEKFIWWVPRLLHERDV
jgi:hypothetical protein